MAAATKAHPPDPLSGRGQPAGGIHPRPRRSADHSDHIQPGGGGGGQAGAGDFNGLISSHLCETGRPGRGGPTMAPARPLPFNNSMWTTEEGEGQCRAGKGAAAVTKPPNNQMLFMVAAPFRERERERERERGESTQGRRHHNSRQRKSAAGKGRSARRERDTWSAADAKQ